MNESDIDNNRVCLYSGPISYYSPSILPTEIPALESTKSNSLYKCLAFNALVYVLENILLMNVRK